MTTSTCGRMSDNGWYVNQQVQGLQRVLESQQASVAAVEGDVRMQTAFPP